MEYFLSGISASIDDNVTFGLLQRIGFIKTAYDEYFFNAGKILTDAAFLTYYSTLSGVSGGASVYLFAQAEVTAVTGVIVLAGGVTAPAGVVIEVGSVASLVGAAGCGVISIVAAKAAARSNNFLNASKNAMNNLPNYNAGNLRSNLSKYTGTNPAGYHAHHNLPQKFRSFFAKFKNLGLNIDDPKYASWVEGGKHLSEARAFNKDWESWININQTSATIEMVLAKARELALKYGYKIFF